MTQPIQMTVLGSADAFNSAGRAHSCYYIQDAHGAWTVDFGPTALMQCARLGVDPSSIDTVFFTHLHGDHAGGLPLLLIDQQYRARRTRPLTLVGPPGMIPRLQQLRHGSFPDVTRRGLNFPLRFEILKVPGTIEVGPRSVQAIRARHEERAISTSLRVEVEGRSLVFSGDTAWQTPLAELARAADLFVCECSSVEPRGPRHIALEELEIHHDEVQVQQWVLSHLNAEMRTSASRVAALGARLAEDGMVLAV